MSHITLADAHESLRDFWFWTAGILVATMLLVCMLGLQDWTVWETYLPAITPITGMIVASRRLSSGKKTATVPIHRLRTAKRFTGGYIAVIVGVFFVWPLLVQSEVVRHLPEPSGGEVAAAVSALAVLQGMLMYVLVTFFPPADA